MRSNFRKAEPRPVISIPLSSVELALEIIAMAGLIFILYVAAHFWSVLPQTIPTHFGSSGKPDGWGGKETLLILPTVAFLLIYLPMTILNRYPHTFNYLWPITPQNAQAQYYYARLLIGCLKAETVGLFGYISWQTVNTALGKAEGMGIWFLPVMLIIIFGTIAFYVRKSYQAR